MDAMTKLVLGSYKAQLRALPESGRVLQAQYTDEYVVVYQAYKASIAEWAVEHQCFGGPDFSFNRVSWIKPNFTWMMYRCGWTEKKHQERVLAIKLRRDYWDEILSQAVSANYNENQSQYETREAWQTDLKNAGVVMQWDPDHEPFTNDKYKRRAIQLGIRPTLLKKFGRDQDCGIFEIEDVTDFVEMTKQFFLNKEDWLEDLHTPVETIFSSHLDPHVFERIME